MQKVTDFLLKYKRYFGAAALLFVFVIVLVNCTGKKGSGLSDTQMATEQTTVPGDTQQAADGYEVTGKLQKNANPELLELMSNYYAAYAGGDLESLEMLAQPLTDNEKGYITTFAEYYEDYQNIVCYSMPGATDDSYMVSVCYDLKFKDVDTLAPGLDFFYVERDGKGNLYINNVYSAYNFSFLDQELDANLYSMILAYEKSADVVALQKEVQSRYDEAVKSDEKLANMVGGTLRNAMAKWRDSVVSAGDNSGETQQTEEPQTGDTQGEEPKEDTQTAEDTKTEDNKTEETDKKEETSDDGPVMVKTLDICNVRQKPSTDAELLGKVDIGVELRKLGTEGDWTKVKFQGQKGYIKSELLKEVKKN